MSGKVDSKFSKTYQKFDINTTKRPILVLSYFNILYNSCNFYFTS